MKKFGLILALTLVAGISLTAPSIAGWRDNAAPSIREFDHSANGG